nr:hypothetical protein [Tanacetum cinerariifolium]
MQMVGGNGGNQVGQFTGQNVRNLNGYNAVQNIKNLVVQNAVQNSGVQNVGNQNGLIVVPGIVNPNTNQNGNGNVVVARAEGNAIRINDNSIRYYNCRGLGHLARNCTQTSTSGTQTDKAPVYDSDGSAEVQLYENGYNNDIFNMFTQEEQYTELLESIPQPHQVQQNDSNVIFEVFIMKQGGGTVEQHHATVEETHAYFKSLYNNLAIEVEKVNTVNRKLRETNVALTTELARYKNQEKCFEISQEKYDKLERCYQKSIYQEQCLTKKINALHLSSGKQITTLNEEIANLNNQLSKEKSAVSSLQEEKKILKSDFKTHEDELFVSKQKDTSYGTSANTKFSKQSIVGKPPSSSKTKLYAVTHLPKSKAIPKVGMFRIDPRKTSREDKFMPINKVRESGRTNPITVLQPHVITKKDVNSDSNGLSSTRVDNNAKTRSYVNGMNSRNANQSANVLNVANQMKHNQKLGNLQSQVIQICLWYFNSGCSKHMTGNLKLLINFVWKFLGTVRFGNDHVAAILGYGDL